MANGRLRVILATRNHGKKAEVAAVMAEAGEGLELASFSGLALPPEDGSSYEENALAKARAAARGTGLPALADDSGLEVEALGGAPGVHSSRYAGPACDPVANNAKLLAALAGVSEGGRRAKFVCVAALVTPEGREWWARGEVAGAVATEPRGAGGFGYDPLFIPNGFDRAFAEMAPAEKNALSHRARAFRAISIYVQRLRRP